MAGRRRHPWRALAALLVVMAVSSAALVHLDSPVRTPVGARGQGRGSFPVVEVAGLGSTGENFAPLTRALQRAGTEVLDFDPDRAGTQPLVYEPAPGASIPEVAADVVQPAVHAALERAGLDPDRQVVDVVAHSMGGLLVRYLVEHPVGRWAERVDDLVMVATPNLGSDVIYWETRPGSGRFAMLGEQMRPGSAFLRRLGTTEPPGEVYTAVGGDPWLLRWWRHGAHGFDDQVPTESVFMDGAALNTYGHFHGRLLPSPEVIRLVLETLRAR